MHAPVVRTKHLEEQIVDHRAFAAIGQVPELMHDDEGYLLLARGDNAFIFARLFLALEKRS